MGCAGSKETGPPQRRLGEISSKPSSKQEGCNPHGQEPVNANIQCSKQTGTYTLGKSGFRLRYAYLSQRGYYPEDLDKNNQDAFRIIPRIDGDDSCMFMGVFDGHGADGDSCSYFVRDNIERHLLATMKEHPEDFKLAYKQAFINCNAEMHKQRFDDSMSGTTAITAFFRDGHLFVANIGDSRAIVGEDKGERVAAYTLSLDQTPYRSDERERIKAAGGAIMSCDQIEGIVPYHENWGVSLGEEIDNGGDPPRVWAPHKNYPGCAFTRSIGDSVAEGLGVFAEPELTCKEITPDDKFIVLASDGVWEFLTNQSVTDMIMKFDEPLDACRAVVAEAYRLWLQYEVRTDDITMIVAFIEEDTAATDEGRRSAQRTSSKRDNSASNLTLGFDVVERAGAENRPVRRGLSREKRQQMMLGNVNDAEEQDDGDFTPVVVPKSEREMASIQQAIKANFLFQHLNESQSKLVYDVMKRVDVQKGDVIIRRVSLNPFFFSHGAPHFPRCDAPQCPIHHTGFSVRCVTQARRSRRPLLHCGGWRVRSHHPARWRAGRGHALLDRRRHKSLLWRARAHVLEAARRHGERGERGAAVEHGPALLPEDCDALIGHLIDEDLALGRYTQDALGRPAPAPARDPLRGGLQGR